MPWRGVTVSEQRQRFIEDYLLNYYSVTELAERFSISRKTAHKWINRHQEHGQRGFHERSYPGQATSANVSPGTPVCFALESFTGELLYCPPPGAAAAAASSRRRTSCVRSRVWSAEMMDPAAASRIIT